MGMMVLFMIWGALCAGAVLRGKMVLWAGLCLVPLGVLSFGWWWDHAGRTVPLEDPFGFEMLHILGFVAMSLITTATGVLSLVVSSLPASPAKPARPAQG
jgi:hypothetical protein